MFEVKGPVDLLKVARSAGISYEVIKMLNPEILRWCSAPGEQAVKLRLPYGVKDHFLVMYNHPAFPKDVQFRPYKVRRGDSLRRIARRYGMYTNGIEELNGFGRRPRLKSGRTILLPLPVDGSRSVSSLKARDYRPRKSRKKRSRSRGRRVEAPQSTLKQLIQKAG